MKDKPSQADDFQRLPGATNVNVHPESTMEKERVAELYKQHSGALQRFLIGVLKDHSSAYDALQLTFTKLIQKGSGVETGAIRSWLFRVAFNEAMLIKRTTRDQHRKVENAAWTLAGNQAAKNINSVDAAIRSEDVNRVRLALERLPDGQREVVIMRIYEGLKFKEISNTMDLPMGTVLSRMQLALEKLRQIIPDEN